MSDTRQAPTHQAHDTLTDHLVPLDQLEPYDRNPRRGNLAAIRDSLVANGQYRPVVANRRTSQVLAGNHTVTAARELGWSHVAVTWVDVDDEQAARIVLVDNRSNDIAGYDDALLAELLLSLPDLEGTGYSDADLAELLASGPGGEPVALTDPDDAPDVPATPVTQPGWVWQLGPHRLACGDATKAATWASLLSGSHRVDAVWTDPPYGVEYVGKTADALTIDNDGRDQDGLEGLLRDALGACLEACSPGAAWYVAAPAGPATLAFAKVLADHGLWRQTLVWVKDAFVLGHSDYHYRHEVIYAGYGPKGPGRRGRGGDGWYGPNNADTVLEVPRPRRNDVHPTMKPVELIVRCLDNSTKPGQLVADPFAGSGSTLIACHGTRRIARLIELDPGYADVICRRWQEHTGDLPVLEATGEPHDFTAEGQG